jgi:DegV family protein with EDD domain
MLEVFSLKKYVIIADSTSDLSEELRKKYDVEYINGYATFPDGKEHSVGLQWDIITENDFYESIKNKNTKYTTAPANIDDYVTKFEFYLKQGYDVLSISLSGGMSGTYNFTLKAQEILKEKYPENKVYCVDSRRYSLACGLLVILASEQRKLGKDINEVYDYLEAIKNKIHQAGSLDDLFFLARAGRISFAKAFMGTLIGIKPMGDFDSNGMTTVLTKVKGWKNAFKFVVEYMKKTIELPEEQIILIANSNRTAQLEELKSLIQKEFNPKQIYTTSLYLSTAINVGPGLLGVYYIGKELSKDLEFEKQITKEIESTL